MLAPDGSNRTVWHLNWVQTNDLLDIELFDHLTVHKFNFVYISQMFYWIFSYT